MSTPAYNHPDQAPMGDLVRELFRKVGEFNRAQLRLKKAEVKAEGKKIAATAVFAVVSGMTGFVALVLSAISLMLLLSKVVDTAAAAVITTVVFAAVAFFACKRMMTELRKDVDTIDIEEGGKA